MQVISDYFVLTLLLDKYYYGKLIALRKVIIVSGIGL